MKNKNDLVKYFLTNPEFVRWVRHPDADLDLYWNNWIEGNPASKKSILRAKALVLALKEQKKLPSQVKKAELLNKIINPNQASGQDKFKVKPAPGPEKSKLGWVEMGQWNKIAAILLVVLLFSGMLNFLNFESPQSTIPVKQPTASIVKETVFGEKLNFKLSDGSEVWLNSGSKLVYPETFDSSSRNIELWGEAYFEVVEDETRPFRVKSQDLVTEVLGTGFNINAIDESMTKVALVTGKIMVKNEHTSENHYLEPGQQLDYYNKDNRSEINAFFTQSVIGWKDGVLDFRNARLSEIVGKLERWYGVKINLKGTARRTWNISGQFENQDLDLVLDRLSYIEDFTYSLNQKNVNINLNPK